MKGVEGSAVRPLTPDELEQNKATAEHILGRLDQGFSNTLAQQANASKWLLSTLVAVNGGGALATINLLPRLFSPVLPAALFAAGLLLTLLSGVVIQHVAEASIPPMEVMAAFWRRVMASGEVDADEHQATVVGYRRIVR